MQINFFNFECNIIKSIALFTYNDAIGISYFMLCYYNKSNAEIKKKKIPKTILYFVVVMTNK